MGTIDVLGGAREAEQDARRCRRQLKVLASVTDERVASMMKRHLESRLKSDEQAISTAAELILSSDRLTDWQRDVLIQRYVLGKAWNDVARAVNSSPRQCMYDQKAALAALDARG